jgi:hypothetical protein
LQVLLQALLQAVAASAACLLCALANQLNFLFFSPV